ncbi:MAG: Peptidase family [Mucilaginibacter sp.]|nr:Peptidase family [Mucilaginibacter sp.]
MQKIILLIGILFISIAVNAQDIKAICNQINDLNTQVTNGTIKRPDAAKQFKTLIEQIRNNKPVLTAYSWVFPLKGYKSNAIGGTNGNGYSDKGYNYLDGNKHTAHPAHDIFINDRNQDDIDDRTHKPVDVLTVDDGLVIACSNEWEPASNLRGGKYIWIYHQQHDIITYYAHNQAIFVKPGDEVKQGQKIAEVGRTGYNAYKKRSPTHLHFSAFHLVNDLPIPYNPYQQLKKAKTL